MKIVIKENPIPAVRMTHKSQWFGNAKHYRDWKSNLADEIKLTLTVSRIKNGRITIENKFPASDMPSKRILTLKGVKFYRNNKRRCDIDNLLKMLLDLLQTARIIYNDDQIRKIESVELIKEKNEEPRFEFELI